MHIHTAALWVSPIYIALVSASQHYVLEDDYTPSAFASMFEFYTGDDPTHGYVNYLSQQASQSSGLFSTTSSSIRLGVDSTDTASGRGRNSIRVESTKRYNSGLFIFDASHMPEGCGTWPAYWLYGPNWPQNGELDVIEGVNTQGRNSFAAHTGPGCSITNSGFSGSLKTGNCDVNAPGQGTNVGCAIEADTTQSYGTGFNQNGGGVYATQWTDEAISIWFFPRQSVPADVTSGAPDPFGWGLPQARFSSPCNIGSAFNDQRIVINTALCGDWAAQVWSQDSICSASASTCQDYVRDNPSAFANAYWSINSLKVYQQQAGEAQPSATTAATTQIVTATTSVVVVPSTFSTVVVSSTTGDATTASSEIVVSTTASQTSALPSTFATSTLVVTTTPPPQTTTAEVTSVYTTPAWTTEAAGQGWGGYAPPEGNRPWGGHGGRGGGGGWAGRGGWGPP